MAPTRALTLTSGDYPMTALVFDLKGGIWRTPTMPIGNNCPMQFPGLLPGFVDRQSANVIARCPDGNDAYSDNFGDTGGRADATQGAGPCGGA